MVASGVASKGLDFNDIQHVIIFSMPKEIEDYVHQIGRTGRSGKTGIATAFVNMNTPEQTLLDLKYLLMEAGQKWVLLVWLASSSMTLLHSSEFHRSCKPSTTLAWRKGPRSRAVLSVEVGPVVTFSSRAAHVASGLGHGISNCPKLEDVQRRQMASQRAVHDGGGGY